MKGARFGFILFLFAIVIVVVAFVAYFPGEVKRLDVSRHAVDAPSVLYASLTITYDNPPIVSETYETLDDNGLSSFSYRIRGYNGRQVTVSAPPRKITDVSYFFGALVEDGIWNLTSLPTRGNASIHYRIDVRQTADYKHGEHIVTFTDPHWWATTAGRQYSITLSKGKPVPDLMTLKSTTLADPHYEKIVNAFRAFGSNVFRKNVANARRCVLTGKDCPSNH